MSLDSTGQKIAQPLRRSAEPPAPGPKRRALDLALEFDAGQRSGGRRAEVVGRHGDHQPRVGERRVPARQAHAVHDHPVRLGRRRHDPAAGAHAEAVDAALGCVGGQLVERGRKLGMAGGGAVLNLIDERLRVLDPDADGDRLAFERDAAAPAAQP